MKKIISASRRTDLPACFPEWLAASLRAGRAVFRSPRGGERAVGLAPGEVHTLVLWSKDFSRLLAGESGLLELLARYDQLYFLFSITGLGGTRLERGVPEPATSLAQLPALVALAGDPRRVSIRFDPVVFWSEEGLPRSNVDFFDRLAPAASALGIRDVRFSVVQRYGKALRRTSGAGFELPDPPVEVQLAAARKLAVSAASFGLVLHACSQDFLAAVPGITPSSCIDGRLLRELHPRQEDVSTARDRTQRPECRCSSSLDIGSYDQACAHACLYCYANPGP